MIGCDGEKCLTEKKPSSTKERCMRRKDPGPNVDPVGMTFFGPGTIKEPKDKAQCEGKNSCASIRTEFQQMTYQLYKQTADYQKLYYKDKKSFAPTSLTLKESKFFMNMMKTESSSIPIQHPYNSGIDYLVFEASEDNDDVKNIFSVKEQAFVSAKDLKIKSCD